MHTRQHVTFKLRTKASETLALDLRGHGASLVAPKLFALSGSELRPSNWGRPTMDAARTSALAGEKMTEACCSAAVVSNTLPSKQPPFRGVHKGRSLQDERVSVAVKQVRSFVPVIKSVDCLLVVDLAISAQDASVVAE